MYVQEWWVANAKEKKLDSMMDPSYLQTADAVSKCFVYFDKVGSCYFRRQM